MKVNQLANKIYSRYEEIVQLAPEGSASVTMHNVPNLHLLNSDWRIEPTLLRGDKSSTGPRLYLVASRGDVTLFSKEQLILNSSEDEDENISNE